MNCDEFRRNWTEWHEGWMASAGAEMASHRDRCAACARYDRQMRRLVGALARLPLPDEARSKAGTVRPEHARTPVALPWHAGPRWLALAATLVIGIALGLLLSNGFDGDGDVIVAEPVALGEPGEHRIAVAFDSPRPVEQVQFVVELPAGVELIGFPGQRVVRWEGRLAKGRSRLELPLHVSPDAMPGKLITRILHKGGERRLVVPLEATADADTAALGVRRA